MMFGLFGKRRAAPETEAKAKRVVDAMCDMFMIARMDPDGVIHFINANFRDVTGYSAEEALGQNFGFLMRGKDRESPKTQAQWDDLRRGKALTFIGPLRAKSGDEIWLKKTYAPLLDAEGNVDEIVFIAQDITEFHLRRRDNRSKVDAISRTMAVIEFELDGTIANANRHFLDATGYGLEEIRGKHHRIFMPPGEAEKPEYKAFWKRLGAGASESGQVRRVDKAGHTLWLEATYETLVDPEGRPFKVVKYAFDITRAKNREAEVSAQLDAIQRVQAVIEFDSQGRILAANDKFCNVMGYGLDQIRGKHHSMFVEPTYANSSEYKEFWDKLRSGEGMSGRYRRIGEGGREVFIEASYNPIPDAEGNIVKVVKYAVDTTNFQVTLRETGDALARLAEGDLQTRIERNLGNLDEIREKFNGAIGKIDLVIADVLGQSLELVADTAAIRGASDDLSRRTERQAATLEQSAAALEELNNSVHGTSQQSQEARDRARLAKDDTQRSAAVVQDAMEAMERIANSSEKISKITNVIDDISFQTNLLALNAGIEAARAGEAGRGFAVVASEVRALAQRSSDAAQEIAQLISESGLQVRQGVELVGQAGTALREIDGRVSEILDLSLAIASAAEEQAGGLNEMNRAIADLDRVTQQNAAMAEETNAAVHSLGTKVETMQQEAHYFKTSSSAESGFGAAPSRRMAG
ncbi:PAS domain-containing methyl-accepting chemotaxis protein [Mangrovicoccus sp. HB161399]|uniref:methyl-accepting chemotaxis protein n=1 Tax=Mangrovicoccus sp. HB161399 TaxID=2720392 RepID=UPI001554B6B7|nr:PAS domain-containing methyl-accepting chemotaxis protein [Mangrovicoccus sp. HB161399]